MEHRATHSPETTAHSILVLYSALAGILYINYQWPSMKYQWPILTILWTLQWWLGETRKLYQPIEITPWPTPPSMAGSGDHPTPTPPPPSYQMGQQTEGETGSTRHSLKEGRHGVPGGPWNLLWLFKPNRQEKAEFVVNWCSATGGYCSGP